MDWLLGMVSAIASGRCGTTAAALVNVTNNRKPLCMGSVKNEGLGPFASRVVRRMGMKV